MNQVLAPTIDYAGEGFPVSPVISYYLDRSWQAFNGKYADTVDLVNIRDTWFKGGTIPQAGDVFRNPDLANTLEIIDLTRWERKGGTVAAW